MVHGEAWKNEPQDVIEGSNRPRNDQNRIFEIQDAVRAATVDDIVCGVAAVFLPTAKFAKSIWLALGSF